MSNRTNLGKSLARRSAAARKDRGLLGVVDALGLTADDLFPIYELRLADGRIVEQRGSDSVDAARRYFRATGERAGGARRKA